MNITFLDFRKNPSKLLNAIEQRQTLILTHRGKAIAQILPVQEAPTPLPDVSTLPAFGMWQEYDELQDVTAWLAKKRKGKTQSG